MTKHLRIGWLKSLLAHRRITVFWLVALLSLTVPWSIKGWQLAEASSGQVYEDCAVLSIYDGDTMTVRCDGQRIKVRLYCIDAPEMAQKPWGAVSRDHLRQATGATVRLVEHDHDRYGRTVGEMYSGDSNLNLLQVQSGNAAEYDKYCSDFEYRRAEREARAAGAGVWSKPGLHQTPWDYRHR